MKKVLLVAVVLAAMMGFSSFVLAGPFAFNSLGDCTLGGPYCRLGDGYIGGHDGYGHPVTQGSEYTTVLGAVGQAIGSVIDSQRKVTIKETFCQTDSQGNNRCMTRIYKYSRK